MNKVLIFGTTMFSKEMMYILQEDGGWQIEGFTLDQAYKTEEEFCGLPVFAFEMLDNIFDMSEVGILPTIGYSEMNDHRERFFKACESKGYMIHSYIDKTAIIHAKKIGSGNLIFDHVNLSYDSVVGKGNIFKGSAVIAHDSVVGDFNYFAGLNHIAGATIIGDKNFFGISSIVRSKGKIGNKNLIGAATYVNEELGKFMVVSQAKNRLVQSTQKAISVYLK